MLSNRQETVSFSKIQRAVQRMTSHEFNMDHLAQIKFIDPEAFVFSQKKIFQFGQPVANWKYDLVIRANISESNLSPSKMLERQRRFYGLLEERLKAEYKNFLATAGNFSPDQFIGYHPNFNMDTCKPIEMSPLPRSPEEEKISASSVLGSRISNNFKMKNFWIVE